MKKPIKKKTQKEFSKKMALAILVVALVDLQFPFILALMGKEEIAQELAQTICSAIIAVYPAYLLKAFFGKKAEVATQQNAPEVICLEPEEPEEIDPIELEEGWETLKL